MRKDLSKRQPHPALRRELSEILDQPPSLENLAVALACPFRAYFLDGPPERLYCLRITGEKQRNELVDWLALDFDIVRLDSLDRALEQVEEYEGVVFRNSIALYLLTSAVEIGLTTLDRCEDACRDHILAIAEAHIGNWYDFADAFMEGEDLIPFFSMKQLRDEVEYLLHDGSSPWRHIRWSEIEAYARSLQEERRQALL
ncbi:MAG TPA: DUF1266 domain-containing protein [Clostridiales bacterium]|nr:DUF1266 domain-containing protein [Clostridiales bacterium]